MLEGGFFNHGMDFFSIISFFDFFYPVSYSFITYESFLHFPKYLSCKFLAYLEKRHKNSQSSLDDDHAYILKFFPQQESPENKESNTIVSTFFYLNFQQNIEKILKSTVLQATTAGFNRLRKLSSLG